MSFLMLALAGAVGSALLLTRRPWLAWVVTVPILLVLWGLRGGNAEPLFWTGTLLYMSISMLPAFPPWKRSLFEVSEARWMRLSFRAEKRVLAADPLRGTAPAVAVATLAPLEPLPERPSVAPGDGEPLAPSRPAIHDETLFASESWLEDELDSVLCILDDPEDTDTPAPKAQRPAPRDLATVEAAQAPGTVEQPEPVHEVDAEDQAIVEAMQQALIEESLIDDLELDIELRDDATEHRAALAFAAAIEQTAGADVPEPLVSAEPTAKTPAAAPAEPIPEAMVEATASLAPELQDLQAELTAKLDAIAEEALVHEELEDITPIVAALQAELAQADPLQNASYEYDVDAAPAIKVYELSEGMCQRSTLTDDDFEAAAPKPGDTAEAEPNAYDLDAAALALAAHQLDADRGADLEARLEQAWQDATQQAAESLHAEVLAPEPESIVEALSEPIAEPTIEPIDASIIESVAGSIVEPIAESASESIAESVADALIEPIAESIARPIVESFADSYTEPNIEPAAEPIAESVAKSIIESFADSIVEPIAESVTESVTEPTIDLSSLIECGPAIVDQPFESPTIEVGAPAPTAAAERQLVDEYEMDAASEAVFADGWANSAAIEEPFPTQESLRLLALKFPTSEIALDPANAPDPEETALIALDRETVVSAIARTEAGEASEVLNHDATVAFDQEDAGAFHQENAGAFHQEDAGAFHQEDAVAYEQQDPVAPDQEIIEQPIEAAIVLNSEVAIDDEPIAAETEPRVLRWSPRLLGTPTIDAEPIAQSAEPVEQAQPEQAQAEPAAQEHVPAEPVAEAPAEPAPDAPLPAEPAGLPTAESGPYGDESPLSEDLDRAPAALPQFAPTPKPSAGPSAQSRGGPSIGTSLAELFGNRQAPRSAPSPASVLGDALESAFLEEDGLPEFDPSASIEFESPAGGTATRPAIPKPRERRARKVRLNGPSAEAAVEPGTQNLEALERLRTSARRAARLDLVEGLFGRPMPADARALDAAAQRLVGNLRVDDLEAVLRSAPRDFTDLERLLGGLGRTRSGSGDSPNVAQS